MWARIQEMAIRQETPEPLELGGTIHDVTIKKRLPSIVGNRRYQGLQNTRLVEVRQFYDVDTPSFLRWQQQARLSTLKQHPLLVQAFREWAGGVMLPDLRLPTLATAHKKARLQQKNILDFLYKLAEVLAALHRQGIAHLNLDPQSILYNPATNSPHLAGFGQSHYPHWQDLWWGVKRPASNSRFVAPEIIRGCTVGLTADVFSFGALMQQLNKTPGKDGWRALIPALCRNAGQNAPKVHLPPLVDSLIHNARSTVPQDRPTMEEAVTILREYAHDEFHVRLEQEHIPLCQSPAQRIVLFIKPDEYAKKLFATAHSLSKKTNAALLFISLIPANLAYGELELFKGRLFKILGAGLQRCREHKMIWGLRLLENVDAEKAAYQLTKRLAPDIVCCGTPTKKGVLRRMVPGVVKSIEKAKHNMVLIKEGE